MRIVVLNALVVGTFLLVGPVAAGSSGASSDGERLANAASPTRAAPKPRIRYVFGTVGTQPTSLLFGAGIDTGGVPTTYYVEYGPTPELGSRTPTETLAGTTLGDVRVTASDATPATKYHYRFVIANASGTVQTSARTVQSGGRAPRIYGAFTRDGSKQTDVYVSATIDTGGLDTTYHVEYGQTPRVSSAKLVLPGVPSPGTLTPTKRVVRIPLTLPEPGKQYFARIVAVNAVGGGSYASVIASGKHRSGVASPAVLVGATSTSAVVQTVIDTGGLVTTYHVEYGKGARYGSQTPLKRLSPQTVNGWNRTAKEIKVTLAGLAPATRYHFRVVATNAEGTDFAGRSFVTGGDKPSISYYFAGPGSAPLSMSFGAGVDTGGLPTTYHAEYGPDTGYGSRTPEVTLTALPRPTSFRATVDDARTEAISVQRGATYHYRIVASNAAGTTYSKDRTFVLR